MTQHTGSHTSGGQRSSSGSRGGEDMSEVLFGRGALQRADKSPSSSSKSRQSSNSAAKNKTTPPPLTAAAGTTARVSSVGAIATGASAWYGPELVSSIPAGSSRDALKTSLQEVLTYSDEATWVLGLVAVSSIAWWTRSTYAAKLRQTEDKRKNDPSPADTLAAQAVKLRPGTVLVRPRWKVGSKARRALRQPRHLRKLVITYPGGALSSDPSRDLCLALSKFFGMELRPSTWDIGNDRTHRARVVLVPGALPPVERDPIPEAKDDPSERATQSLPKVLGKEGEDSEVTVHKRHENGTPREFTLHHQPTFKTALDGNQVKIAEGLRNMLPAAQSERGWKVEIEAPRDRINVRELAAMPRMLPRPLLDQKAEFQGRQVLATGVDENEKPVGIDLSVDTPTPHGLFTGPTGTGKTSAFRSLIVAASHYGWEIWGIDPKRIEMLGFDSWPGFTRLAVTIDQMRQIIHAAYAEMMHRYKAVEDRTDPKTLGPLLVILDEFLILRAMLITAWKEEGNKGDPPELGLITEMLALARVSRVHLMIGVQRPDAKLFQLGGRDNLPHRLTLGPLSSEHANMIYENHYTGTKVPRIQGRGVTTTVEGDTIDTHCYFTPSLDHHPVARERMKPADRDLVDSLRPTTYGQTTWSTTKDGLHIPASATAEDATNVSPDSPEAVLLDVDDTPTARELLREGTRDVAVRLEDDEGGYDTAVIEQVSEDGNGIRLDVQWTNGAAEARIVNPDDVIWVLDENASN